MSGSAAAFKPGTCKFTSASKFPEKCFTKPSIFSPNTGTGYIHCSTEFHHHLQTTSKVNPTALAVT
jgi:hypothetical protein